MLRLKPPREAQLEVSYVIKLAIMQRGGQVPLEQSSDLAQEVVPRGMLMSLSCAALTIRLSKRWASLSNELIGPR